MSLTKYTALFEARDFLSAADEAAEVLSSFRSTPVGVDPSKDRERRIAALAFVNAKFAVNISSIPPVSASQGAVRSLASLPVPPSPHVIMEKLSDDRPPRMCLLGRLALIFEELKATARTPGSYRYEIARKQRELFKQTDVWGIFLRSLGPDTFRTLTVSSQVSLLEFIAAFPRDEAYEGKMLSSFVQILSPEALTNHASTFHAIKDAAFSCPPPLAQAILMKFGKGCAWVTHIDALLGAGVSAKAIAKSHASLSIDDVERAMTASAFDRADPEATRRTIETGTLVRNFSSTPIKLTAKENLHSLLSLAPFSDEDALPLTVLKQIAHDSPEAFRNTHIPNSLHALLAESLSDSPLVSIAAQELRIRAKTDPTGPWASHLEILASREPIRAGREYVQLITSTSGALSDSYVDAVSLAKIPNSDVPQAIALYEPLMRLLDADPREDPRLDRLFHMCVVAIMKNKKPSGKRVKRAKPLRWSQRRASRGVDVPTAPEILPKGLVRVDQSNYEVVLSPPVDDGGLPVKYQFRINAGGWRPLTPIDMARQNPWEIEFTFPTFERVTSPSEPLFLQVRAVSSFGASAPTTPLSLEIPIALTSITAPPPTSPKPGNSGLATKRHEPPAKRGIFDQPVKISIEDDEETQDRVEIEDTSTATRPYCRALLLKIREGAVPTHETLQELVCEIHREDVDWYSVDVAQQQAAALRHWQLDRTLPSKSAARDIESAMKSDLRSWQQEAHRAWAAHGRVGVVEAVTGAGKTTFGALVSREALNRGMGVVVVVPLIMLQGQWIASLKRAGIENIRTIGGPKDRDWKLGRDHNRQALTGWVTVAVRNTFSENYWEQFRDNTPNYLLIADEVHNYSTANFLDDERYAWRLGLTATLDATPEGLRVLEAFFGRSRVFEYGPQRAIADGAISPYNLTVLRVPLSEDDARNYRALREGQRMVRKQLANLGIEAKDERAFRARVPRLTVASGVIGTLAREYEGLGEEVSKLLNASDEKPEALRRIAPMLAQSGPSAMFTDFRDAKESSMNILEGLGIRVMGFDSTVSPEKREEAIGKLVPGKPQVLVAPKVLDEGIDIPGLEFGVMLGSSRKRRRLIQRLGRLLRISENKPIPRMFIMVGIDTDDDPAMPGNEQLQQSAFDFYWENAMETPQVITIGTR